jgi:hypothetical protein
VGVGDGGEGVCVGVGDNAVALAVGGKVAVFSGEAVADGCAGTGEGMSGRARHEDTVSITIAIAAAIQGYKSFRQDFIDEIPERIERSTNRAFVLL